MVLQQQQQYFNDIMTNAHETQCKVKTLKTDTEETNQWKKIKTQSINVREQHSKYKVLFRCMCESNMIITKLPAVMCFSHCYSFLLLYCGQINDWLIDWLIDDYDDNDTEHPCLSVFSRWRSWTWYRRARCWVWYDGNTSTVTTTSARSPPTLAERNTRPTTTAQLNCRI